MFQKNPVIDGDGTKERYINGLRHREDGPAIEYMNGYKAWYVVGTIQPQHWKVACEVSKI